MRQGNREESALSSADGEALENAYSAEKRGTGGPSPKGTGCPQHPPYSRTMLQQHKP